MKFVGAATAAFIAVVAAVGKALSVADLEPALMAAAVAGLFLWWAYRGEPAPNQEDRLARLPPWPDAKCIFCSDELVQGPPWRCQRCAVVRIEAAGGDR